MKWLKDLFVKLGLQVLETYFTDRAVEFYPSAGRPMMTGMAKGIRRVASTIQVCIELPTGDSRWISIRRGRRDDKTGVWRFWDE